MTLEQFIAQNPDLLLRRERGATFVYMDVYDYRSPKMYELEDYAVSSRSANVVRLVPKHER